MAAKIALAIDEMLTKLKGEVPLDQWTAAFALFEAAFAVAVHGTKKVPAELIDSAISWQKRRRKPAPRAGKKKQGAKNAKPAGKQQAPRRSGAASAKSSPKAPGGRRAKP